MDVACGRPRWVRGRGRRSRSSNCLNANRTRLISFSTQSTIGRPGIRSPNTKLINRFDFARCRSWWTGSRSAGNLRRIRLRTRSAACLGQVPGDCKRICDLAYRERISLTRAKAQLVGPRGGGVTPIRQTRSIGGLASANARTRTKRLECRSRLRSRCAPNAFRGGGHGVMIERGESVVGHRFRVSSAKKLFLSLDVCTARRMTLTGMASKSVAKTVQWQQRGRRAFSAPTSYTKRDQKMMGFL